MKTRGKAFGTTWYNLSLEVVPPLVVGVQWLTKEWYGWYNLFESLTCARGKQPHTHIYRRSWQKVVPTVPPPRKLLSFNGIRWYNLIFEVVPGCTAVVVEVVG
jgi:hypothetical protein